MATPSWLSPLVRKVRMDFHTHFHTHVNTHSCDCGRNHVSAHTQAHTYLKVSDQVVSPAAEAPVSMAKRTRSHTQRATWENTPWRVDDKDIRDLLAYLLLSNDPWERSLIPQVEKDAIAREAKRSKKNF